MKRAGATRCVRRGLLCAAASAALVWLAACASLPVAPLDPPEGDDAGAEGASPGDGASPVEEAASDASRLDAAADADSATDSATPDADADTSDASDADAS